MICRLEVVKMATSIMFLEVEESQIYITFPAVLQDIRGNDTSLSEYSGKVLLIVNVASKW